MTPTGGVMPRGEGKTTLSEREMEAMSVLWERRSATVAEVEAELNEAYEPEIAYNTVLTLLRRLRAKGWARIEDEGRGYRWFPALDLEYARWWELERIKDLLFRGSYDRLLGWLLSDRHLSARELERYRRLIDQRLKPPAPR